MSCCCCSGFLIAGAILAVVLAKFYCCRKKNEKPKLKKEDYKKDIVYLYQFKRNSGLPNMSPYCVKVETFLRGHNIQYEVIEGNFQRSQKGLLPFIELNGEQIADSEFIIEHLSKHFNIKDNSPKEISAAGRAVSRIIHIVFRLKDHEGIKKLVANFLPGFLIPIGVPVIKMLMRRRLGGYGSFTESELKQLYRRNLQAASDILGERKFFGGNEINLADCSVIGQLGTFYYYPSQNDLKCIIDEFPNLKRQINTIFREYYSDFDVVNRLVE